MTASPARCVPIALVLVLASACATRGALKSEPGFTPDTGWGSPLRREHPLVGRIWGAREGAYVDGRALATAASGADFLLLGEMHDNVDHHLLQAALVRMVTASGKRPALAFEMLDSDKQDRIDAALASSPKSAGAIALAVEWDRSGWPKFELYEPVFVAGLEAGLPVVAANLSRSEARDVVRMGLPALDPALRIRLERLGPVPEELMVVWRDEMRESHCGELPEEVLEPMVLAQRARDARLAERLLSTGADRGAILVAGAGHVRVDRAVPVHLASDAPAKRTVAIAFLEVSDDMVAPDAAGAGRQPYDYVVYTPAMKRPDPCASLRARKK